jgi:hypothetical protein
LLAISPSNVSVGTGYRRRGSFQQQLDDTTPYRNYGYGRERFQSAGGFPMAQAEEKPPLSIASLGLGAIVLAAIATLFGLRSGGSASKSEDKAAKEKEAPAETLIGPDNRTFIYNYLHNRSLNSSAPPGVKLPYPLFTQAEAIKTKIITATVPDPVDTAFGSTYDQIVEALSRAVCDDDYVPSGQWNPWEPYLLNRVARKSGYSRQTTAFERFPGVLLFRGKDDPENLMIVLLVSETANAIRAEPLKNALDLALDLQTVKGRDSFRLVAPNFTGSQPSLFRTLTEWAESKKLTKPQFKVISGSANGLAKHRNACELNRITLHSTVVPSSILQNAAVEYLRRRNLRPEQDLTETSDPRDVALLTESNTAFGRTVSFFNKDTGQRDYAIVIQYPMHISRLQAEYARKRIEVEKRIGMKSGDAGIGSEEHDIRPNADTVRSLDEAETAPINDRAVDDITTAIRQSRVRYVGIVATDPHDKVFLIERIKRDCPQVAIFTTSMDLHFTLPENRQIMRGVVISTTYPLYPANQNWVQPTESRRQTFKSQSGQGYYNAAVFHLADMSNTAPLLREYAAPVFALPSGEQKPPVWVVTIGENGHIVPLALSTNYTTNIKNADDSLLMSSVPVTSAPGRTDQNIALPLLGAYRTAALLVLVSIVGINAAAFWRRSPTVFFAERDNRKSAKASELPRWKTTARAA